MSKHILYCWALELMSTQVNVYRFSPDFFMTLRWNV